MFIWDLNHILYYLYYSGIHGYNNKVLQYLHLNLHIFQTKSNLKIIWRTSLIWLQWTIIFASNHIQGLVPYLSEMFSSTLQYYVMLYDIILIFKYIIFQILLLSYYLMVLFCVNTQPPLWLFSQISIKHFWHKNSIPVKSCW
jgi:hypothetical protein